jgi:putative transposase
MLVLEAKLYGKLEQFKIIDEMIRTAQFIRNRCIRHWMDNKGVGQYDLSALTKDLAKEFPWCGKLNSSARQAAAERAWASIKRFYDNCRQKTPGKKGFPRFKKNVRSVEYKVSGWKLSDDRKQITFTDKFKAGTFKLRGGYDLHFYSIDQIKRVRIVRRADGYYAQLCVDVERKVEHKFTAKVTGIDLGLKSFYTDSDGKHIENPRWLRKSERRLNRLYKRVSKRQKGGRNRARASLKLARQHLRVSRQRKDWLCKLASALVASNDLIAYEDLQVRNLVKNHHLAKSISDASWSIFTNWIDYYCKIHGIVCVAVPPQYTSQDCSACGERVKKSLSTRTHKCKCGTELHRDHNAAINILAKALKMLGKKLPSTVGRTETNAWGENALYRGLETVLGKVTR